MSTPSARELRNWHPLSDRAAACPPLTSLAEDADRNRSLRLTAADILFDFSKQRVDEQVVQLLLGLADERAWRDRVNAMFAGDPINSTERRAALHTALRAPADMQPAPADDAVHAQLERIARFVDAVRTGQWRGFTGKAITTIVHIGIGGSHLGPELAVDALAKRPGRFDFHFVANVDGAALERALAAADPETTLFTIVSKSFTTLETRENASSARNWLLERSGRLDAIARHFVAVTANPAAAAAFGLPEQNLFPIWDWVGGRYSMWSAVGIPIALAIGMDGFRQLLAGAHSMDRHFLAAPGRTNAPLLAALIGIWNYNFLGVNNHAVLPYDQRLRLLPNYLQQLETESNGKRVRHGGEPVGVHTMAVLWGGEGTTGQHAFHQMLHQGTRSFTADFIVARTADHPWPHQHRWLLANCFSQGQAMLSGRTSEDAHRVVPGEHATTTMLIDALTPATLGALLAFYEHKVFCQGLIWDINSFDQWGVELGKQLANVIFEQLGGASTLTQDETTRALVASARTRQSMDPK